VSDRPTRGTRAEDDFQWPHWWPSDEMTYVDTLRAAIAKIRALEQRLDAIERRAKEEHGHETREGGV
jgi:hypothetical protein